MRIPGSVVFSLAVLAFAGTGCSKAGSMSGGAVTYLSVIHGAPYTPAATFYLNDTLYSQTAGIATGAFSPQYGTIKPGTYAAKFQKAGTDSILDQLTASPYDTLSLYTLLLYNGSEGQGAHLVKIADDFSVITDKSRSYYRFFHLAPDYPDINVYFNGNLVQSGRTPADNATNKALDSFQPIPAGNYAVTVTDATTDSVLLSSASLTLSGGNAFTVWITGLKTNLSINALQAKYANR